MNTAQSLDNIIDMMGSVRTPEEINEMTSVVRRSILLYYVQPKHFSKTRLRKIYDYLKKNLDKSVKKASDRQISNYLKGRIYAKQIAKENDSLEFEFYVTKNKYDGIDVVRMVNTKGITNPKFLKSGSAYKIDEEIISLSGKTPGDSVRMFKTSRRFDQIEDEFLQQFQEALQKVGLGTRTRTVIVGGKVFYNVANIIKKPGRANDPGADFVFVDVDGKVVPESGISHKGQVFRSYGGIRNLSSQIKLLELKSFIEDVKEEWKKVIRSGRTPSEVGFIRHLPDDVISKILYKGDIKFVVIGNLKFDYDGKKEAVIISGPGLHQEPSIPDKEYRPVLKSIYGTGGTKFQYGLAADLYFNLSEMGDMNLVSASMEEKILSMKMEPVKDNISEIPEVADVVIAAKLPIRLECVPSNKARSKRLKKI